MGLLPDRTDLLKIADATVGAVLCRMLGRLHFLIHGGEAPEDVSPDRVRRILVIRPGGLGDMIILLPVLRALRARFPGAEIDLVCEKRNVDVLRLRGLEARAMPYDSNPVRFLRGLRRRKYDVAVDTEQFHNFSAIFGLFSGAPVRIGFKVNPIRNPLYSHLINYELDGPEGKQFMRLLEPLGIADASWDLEGEMRETELSLPGPIQDQLRSVAPPAGFAVLNPGSSTVYKVWPAERFAKLAGRLYAECGLAVVLTGSRKEAKLSEALAGRMREAKCPVVSLAGRLTLAQTAAVLKQARLFVGCDSGLSHLAVALGVPSAVIFGPSDHRKWGVQKAHHAVVRKVLPCAPCFIFGYHRPCRTLACMRGVAVDDVMAACRKVI
jgi:ADP-heptose:LPS heptosyltransferase